MSATVNLIARAHALLARLYPYHFRVEFEDEMCTVFTDALADAAPQGVASVFNLWWRELRDWPRRLLTEYWLSMTMLWNWRIFMTDTHQIKNWKIEKRKDALIAALPPLLFGVGIMLTALIVQKPWYEIQSWRLYLGVAIGMALPAIVVGVGGAIALFRRLPDWGYTWAGSAAMGTVLLIKTMAEEQADFGQFIISETFDLILAAVLVLGCLVLLVWAALRGWQQAGLLSIGFASLMGVSVLATATAAPFNRYDLALLAGPFGALLAWLAYHFAVGSDKIRGFVLLGIALLNLGAVLVADRATRSWALANQRPSFALPLLVFITAALLSGPLLGLIGVPVKRAIKGG
jgi:hypothetical protein